MCKMMHSFNKIFKNSMSRKKFCKTMRKTSTGTKEDSFLVFVCLFLKSSGESFKDENTGFPVVLCTGLCFCCSGYEFS